MGGMGGMMSGGKMGKVMGYAMPIMFGLFSLGFTAAFALYMIVNSAFMIVITLVSSGFIWLLGKRSTEGKVVVEDEVVIQYGRKDPNDPSFGKGNKKKKK